MVKRITQTLFDLLAIGTRHPRTRMMSTEVSWWSDLDGVVIGAVSQDTTDGDFAWVVLAKDAVGRFRGVDMNTSCRTERLASAELRLAIIRRIRDSNFKGIDVQGDEPASSLDLFANDQTPETQLHPYFRNLRDDISKSPARRVFEAISPWLVSSDPNLVRDFQGSQFDQRLWEIYLWAMLRDQGYDVQHREAPDLKVTHPWFSFTIEATTVAPSTSGPLADHPEPSTTEEIAEFNANYMPIKFGSPLTSKLNKTNAKGLHYWEQPDAEGLPFILAIADFHKPGEPGEPGSMSYSQSALYAYLYGARISVETVEGRAVFRSEVVSKHTYKGKTIPSGFFDLPLAENVSAVLFSNAGTIAKFDRIGILAGFAPPNHRYLRMGTLFDPDPDALVGIPFCVDVSDPKYEEHWGDEVQIFHNPSAKYPLPPEAFPDAAHVFYRDGRFETLDRGGRVLASQTVILKIVEDENQTAPDDLAKRT